MDLTSSLEAHDGDASRREAALRKGLGEVQQQVEQFSDRARRAEQQVAALQQKLELSESHSNVLEQKLQAVIEDHRMREHLARAEREALEKRHLMHVEEIEARGSAPRR